MRKKKPLLVVIVAIVLIWALPVSSTALSPFDSQLDYYTYNNVHVSTANSPWYDVTINDSHSVGKVHCRTGSIYGCFLIFLPFVGYYLVVRQSGELRADGVLNSGRNYIYFASASGSNYHPDQALSYSGDGTISSNNLQIFQTTILQEYWIFVRIKSTSSQGTPDSDSDISSTISNSSYLTSSEISALRQMLQNYSGSGQPLPPDVVNDFYIYNSYNGSVIPTDIYGQTQGTLPNGNEIPTYPNGQEVVSYTQTGETKIYTVPYDNDTGMPYPTISYNGDSYIIYPDQEVHTDPDTGQPLPDPNDSSKPWIETVTIYNIENQKSDINQEFSRLNDMISDLDGLSSLMESNQADLSSAVDGTRSLVDDVLSWFPAPIIACIVCGAIMIIAVKITGSGKS